jgi:hypothetical protein
MKYYYKQLNENGEIALLLVYDFMPSITDPLIVEITEEEYNAIIAEIRANEPEPEPSETQLKAQAYDILTGAE